MKNKILVLVFVSLLALTGFSFASTANDQERKDDSCCCCCCLSCCNVKRCEDVEVNVENVKDGVVVKITSKKAGVVQKLQEMCAKMKEGGMQKECCKKGPNKEDIKK